MSQVNDCVRRLKLLHLDLLHVSDSRRVHQALEELAESGTLVAFNIRGNDEALNILRNFSRQHGLPPNLNELLCALLEDEDTSKQLRLKVVLAIKYAVRHNNQFMTVKTLIELLIRKWPPDKIIASGVDPDYYTQEMITQLLLIISTLSSRDHDSMRSLTGLNMSKLEKYLVYVNGKHKSEVRRCLINIGHWSGPIGQRRVGSSKVKFEEDEFIRTGENIIRDALPQNGVNVSLQTFKTQQMEAVGSEESLSERTKLTNMMVSNALQRDRDRTSQTTTERGITYSDLPPDEKSLLRWYRTTGRELQVIHQKVQLKMAISSGDILYLRNKLHGFKLAFSQSWSSMKIKISEIICQVSTYQKLDTDLILEFLKVATDVKCTNHDIQRNTLAATKNHCIRLEHVPEQIAKVLQVFCDIQNPKAAISSEARKIGLSILLQEDDRLGKNLHVFYPRLKEKQNRYSALEYIQKQMSTEARSEALKKTTTLCGDLLEIVTEVTNTPFKSEDDFKLRAMAMDVLEDYLGLNWTLGLLPGQINALISIANPSSNPLVLENVARLVLKSLEKGMKNPACFNEFQSSDFLTCYKFLLCILVTPEINQHLKIFTIITLSNSLERPHLNFTSQLYDTSHVEALLEYLGRNDLIRQSTVELKLSEDIPKTFFDTWNIEENLLVSDRVAHILLNVLTCNVRLLSTETTLSSIANAALSSPGKLTKIQSSELLFKWTTTKANDGELPHFFSPPILSRIQILTNSPIWDVRVYASASFCVSLATQCFTDIPLESQNVNFCVNLYQFKSAEITSLDLTKYINHNIIYVIHEASNRYVSLSERVFSLLARIISCSTDSDSTESPQYRDIDLVLATVRAYAELQAKNLPSAMLEAIENLYLSSDTFRKRCGDILEKAVISARIISDDVVEEFSKKLYLEPNNSTVYLRRLLYANNNQDLSDIVFRMLQMELVSLRLLPTAYLNRSNDIISMFLTSPSSSADLFQCLSNYVSDGMTVSTLSFAVISALLSQWSGMNTQTTAVVTCLTNCMSNRQALPKSIIEQVINQDCNSSIKFEFAQNVVQGGQNIPANVLPSLYKLISDKLVEKLEDKTAVLDLIVTMIQHNHHISFQVISQYVVHLANHKNSITSDVLRSVIRLIEVDLINLSNKVELLSCKQIFVDAVKATNLTIADVAKTGILKIPFTLFNETDLQILRQRGINLSHPFPRDDTSAKKNEAITIAEIWQLVLKCSDENIMPNWENAWTVAHIEMLKTEIQTNVKTVRKVDDLLKERNGRLIKFEEFLLQIVSESSFSQESKKKAREECKDILSYVVLEEKVSSSFLKYISEKITSSGDDSDWAKQLLEKAKLDDFLLALREWKINPSEKRNQEVLINYLENPEVCKRYSSEILKEFRATEKKFWKDTMPNIALITAHWVNTDGNVQEVLHGDHGEILANEIQECEASIWPEIIQAYYAVIKILLTPSQNFLNSATEKSIMSLVEYMNVPNLDWNVKALIFKILHHIARYNDTLIFNESVLQFIVNGVQCPTDPMMRGHCYSVVLILRENCSPDWVELVQTKFWNSFFQNSLKPLFGNQTFEECSDNLRLLHTLLTVQQVDLENLRKERNVIDWIQQLMLTDTIILLAKHTQDEIELHPVAKQLCRILDHPNDRLFILNGISDYLAHPNFGLLPPARVLQFVTAYIPKHSKGDPWDRRLVYKAIIDGMAELVCEKLAGNSDAASVSEALLIANSQPFPIQLSLLDNVTQQIASSQDTIIRFKKLLNFIRRNRINHGTFLLCLNDFTEPVTVTDLKAIAKVAALLARTPNMQQQEQIRHLVRMLTEREFKFSTLAKLFDQINISINCREIDNVEGAQILENVFYQLVKYQITSKDFGEIADKLVSTKVPDWISVCNHLVMDGLYAGLQGVKTNATIAHEFRIQNIDNLSSNYHLNYLNTFDTLVQKIQAGNFVSCIRSLASKQIYDWNSEEIWTWADKIRSKIKGKRQLPVKEITEILAVISRAYVIFKNYQLKPTQIICIFCTTIEEEDGGTMLQVSTGSGKSTIIAALALIRALMGFPVDIFTSSHVLAERDAKYWSPFYTMFGLQCDHNKDKGSGYVRGRKPCYMRQIVYGEISQFQFDVLRHEYSGLETRHERKYGYALLDEVDAMLVDDSTKLARLSSTLPGMDLLQIVYHLIWHRLHDIQRRMFSVGDTVYYLEGVRSVDEQGIRHYTYKDATGEDKHISNLSIFICQHHNEPERLAEAFIYIVKDIEVLVVQHLKDYGRALIGDHEFEENRKTVEKLPLSKALVRFARSQMNNWVESALTAHKYSENVHYIIDNGQIKPVDYHTTGTIQTSTNWNNGLHQFLQLKHSLEVTNETLNTNFLSNMAMFRKYGGNLVGFTGTLGSKFGQEIIRDVYSVKTAVVPDMFYQRFLELPSKILSSKVEWLSSVVYSALHESAKKRGVLVICKTIKDANMIANEIEILQSITNGIRRRVDVRVYTRNDQNQEKCVEQVIEGDIIVATNLAGRGTDINTTKVEQYGGLHVILTFLPDSLRVEQQAFGRTARQGNKGTGEIIVIANAKESAYIDELKITRDDNERIRLASFKEKELQLIQKKDELFAEFCKLYSRIRENKELQDRTIKQTGLLAIEQEWAIFLRRIDNDEIKLSEARRKYTEFASAYANDSEICSRISDLIESTENCFYLIQIGNEYYKRRNIVYDNTSKAYESFRKAIKTDKELAAGAYAGCGFTMIRGKSHWIQKNTHEINYQAKATQCWKDALKSLYIDISMYTTAQTLLLNREGSTDSDLFKQLTEKINLTGEYCQNLQASISVVEQSLRRVYATEILVSKPEVSKTWRLDEFDPSIQDCNAFSKITLEFHDLTCMNDVWVDDQAINTLQGGDDRIEIQVRNQNLLLLTECLIPHLCTIHKLQLDDVDSIQRIKEVVHDISLKQFIIKFGHLSRTEPINILESGTLSATTHNHNITVEWTIMTDDLKEVKYRQGLSENSDLVNIPDKNELTLEVLFNRNDELGAIEPFLNSDVFIDLILLDVSHLAVSQNWEEVTEKKGVKHARILQDFSHNTASFHNLTKKCAAEVIETLRNNEVPFVLRLQEMEFHKATSALQNASRKIEDIQETFVKEMGHQFSSSYIPLSTLNDMKNRGLVLLPEFKEKSFIPWRSVVTMGIIASAQVATGSVLIWTGFGSAVGISLIGEGIGDLIGAQRVYANRHISWTDYAIQKSVSLTLSAVTMGLSSVATGSGVSRVAGRSILRETAAQSSSRGVANSVFSKQAATTGVKYIALQGFESVTSRGLNAVVDAVLEFSFDSIRDSIYKEVESSITRAFSQPRFKDALSTMAAFERLDTMKAKMDCWIQEITTSQSDGWIEVWETISWFLCQIFSSAEYLQSTFSIATRIIGMLKDCYEIATVVGKVCDYIRKKIEKETDNYTPTYAIQLKFHVSYKTASEVVNMMEFEDEDSFLVTRYPSSRKLQFYPIELDVLQKLFENMHERKTESSKSKETTSRLVENVANRLTSHIIGVANNQLAKPMTTFVMGKLVESISQEIQKKYHVPSERLSERQIRLRDLKKKKHDDLTDEEKAFILRYGRQMTFVEQMCEDAGRTATNDNNNIVSILRSFPESKGLSFNLTPEQEASVANILSGSDLNLTTAFILKHLSKEDIKLVTDPNFVRSEEDELRKTKFIFLDMQEADRSPLTEGPSQLVNDFVTVTNSDSLYGTFAKLTGCSREDIKVKAAFYVASHEEEFRQVAESSQWSRTKSPHDLATVLQLTRQRNK